ncbi:MAG: hypothetical protein EBE86_006395 [Hormoscilla sp. GUM202]|nr:hypothetical protein [Hormoscilla sp. GUM202]
MKSTVMDKVVFQIGGSGWRETPEDMAIDRNGDVWVTGEFRQSIDIDGDGEDDLTTNGYLDSYVAKFDSEGDLVRAYDFGNSIFLSQDKGIGIATDSNGNAWVLGEFHGSIDIDGDGINDLTSNAEYGNSYLAKFDEEGDFVLAKEIHAEHTVSGKSIAIDSNDNVWTKGRFEGDLDLNGDGINDLTNNGDYDYDSYFAKFDSEGNLVNAFQIGGSSLEVGHGIAIDSDDNVWTTGTFSSTIDIDEDGINDLTNNGFRDGYVAKFDSEGALLFASQIGGKDEDGGRAIATDSNGDAWVLGRFQGNIDIDGDGINDLTDGSLEYPWATDSYVAKFSSNGNFVKVLNIGDYVSAIATDSNDRLWVTGEFEGNIDIDGDGNNDLTSNGSIDSYVAQFDSNGNLVQALNIGGSDSDIGYAIAADSNGNVWAAGTFRDSIDIDGDGNNDLTSNVRDIYVIQVEKATNAAPTDTTAPDTAEEDITVISAPEEVTQLKITPEEPTKAVEPNTSVSFDVNYSTEPAETPTTGIVFGMHWDSSQVAFDPVTGLTSRFSLGAQPISAVLDDPVTNGGLDGDPNTDKYILQAWIDANGNWPNNSNPTLYTANFTALPGFEGTQINFSANSDDLPANSNFVPSSIALTSRTPSPTLDLDIDGNGVIDALTDGLVAIRYLFGFRGETLTEDVVGEGATRDTSEIVAYLDETANTMLDVDGNGTAGALTDGILFLRDALGFEDRALIEGAVSEDATRTTAEAINEHMQSFGMM